MPVSLSAEIGTFRKKWKNRIPVALLYPNTYSVAVSNLGFQLVYTLLNDFDSLVCERFVYPEAGGVFRSLESGRPLSDFPLVFGSVSFEHDFPRLAAMLSAGRIAPFSVERQDRIRPGDPLVILGGVAVFMNPEPLAPFADCMGIGEAEAILDPLVKALLHYPQLPRKELLQQLGETLPGCYVPSLYDVSYTSEGEVAAVSRSGKLPERVVKCVQADRNIAAHSTLLTPEAELEMYMAELGRGCSRGCRFCAAGFIYRPPRLWTTDAVIKALKDRPQGVEKIGLLGMEMAGEQTLDAIINYLSGNDCTLSFSSLRADRISDKLLKLLSHSKLKSVAIAPDGCSERLRSLINKGLSEEDLLSAAVRLVEAGIFHLKLYVMIGLPTEEYKDLDEFIELVHKIQQAIRPIGQKRGRLTEITLSVNSFVPKPLTPFQYCSFGGLSADQAHDETSLAQSVLALKGKIKYFRKAFTATSNLRLKTDHPDKVLQQAVYARADRRIAPVILDVGTGRRTFKQAMKKHGLSSWQYAVRPRGETERLCWDIIDHQIVSGYLWREYTKALKGKQTAPCDITICRRCGVCHEDQLPTNS